MYCLAPLTLFLLLLPTVAFAYIDPGTGSALVQGLIAGVAAIGVTVKLYWHKIVGYFANTNSNELADDDQDARPDERSS